MKYRVQPNRSIQEKKKIFKSKKVATKDSGSGTKGNEQDKISGDIPTKFQFDDDYDNWFPWETY